MPPTVLFVSLSTSLDRYVWTDRFQLGVINRPTRVVEAAGGKALNAARAAANLGSTALVVGLVGGRSGQSIETLARQEPWTVRWIRSEEESKVSTCILDESSGVLTELYEPTSQVLNPRIWPQLLAETDSALTSASVDAVVLSGRAPVGLPPGALPELVQLARQHGVPTYVDSAGESLAHAVTSQPHVIKVNAAEAEELVGQHVSSVQQAVTAVELLVAKGVDVAIVTLGSQGAVCATKGGEELLVDVPRVTSAIAVGGGDTFMGALVSARASGVNWSSALAYASAAALASVKRLEAAVITPAEVEHLLDSIRVTRL